MRIPASTRITVQLLLLFILAGCSAGKKNYSPDKKFGPKQLQADFDLYRKIMETRHPGLYWYTSKPAMDKAFAEGRAKLNDSLTETAFRNILSLVNTRIGCGHTSIRSSKAYEQYIDSLKNPPRFPLYLKVWNDTAVVVQDLNKKDTALTRGTLIESFDNRPLRQLLDTLYQYIPADGNNAIAKDQQLSNGASFGNWYTTVFGKNDSLKIGYRHTGGPLQYTFLQFYKPDTTAKTKDSAPKAAPQKSRDEKLGEIRSLKIDTVRNFAVMDLGSFSPHLDLQSFFRQSFKALRKRKIKELIVDLRTNGGGAVHNANVFTRYLVKRPYKLGDSLLTLNKTARYNRYLKKDKLALWALGFFTHRKNDGYYHFSYYERHRFKPKKTLHYDGSIYLLTGGFSFSATTMVVHTLKGQENVTVVGEPTGGAAYGNSAFMIPDVLLPHTRVRFRLPIYRFVMDKKVPHDGKGILPDIYAGPSVDAIRLGRDYKMEKAMDLILEKRKDAQSDQQSN
ncbi:MAG: peptidase S41 [Niabella sp.]|nr:peptidase S41 [Niabella sp.]